MSWQQLFTGIIVATFLDNKIGSEGTKAIADGLKTNTTLTQLDLELMHIKL